MPLGSSGPVIGGVGDIIPGPDNATTAPVVTPLKRNYSTRVQALSIRRQSRMITNAPLRKEDGIMPRVPFFA